MKLVPNTEKTRAKTRVRQDKKKHNPLPRVTYVVSSVIYQVDTKKNPSKT